MSTLLSKTKQFLDVATYQENPEKAEPERLTEEEIHSRIESSNEFLTRAFGPPKKKQTVEINESYSSYLNRFKQGKVLAEDFSEVVYSGKANTGVQYTITKKSDSDFVVSFKRPNGGSADLATYPTLNGALYMLQSQVPSLIADAQHDTTIGASKDSVAPIDFASFDQNGVNKVEESAELNNAVAHILEQINVESLDMLNEDTRQEILSIASEIAPYI